MVFYIFMIGDADSLADISNRGPSERHFGATPVISPPLANWRNISQLTLLNIYYDMTPAKYVTMIACESNLIPPTLIAVVLYEEKQMEDDRANVI
jgi:translation initiation factor 2B subunit (eIF-2B alpha/beta/delta family)